MADYSKEDLLQLVKRIADYLTIKLSSLFSLSPDSLVRSSLSLFNFTYAFCIYINVVLVVSRIWVISGVKVNFTNALV